MPSFTTPTVNIANDKQTHFNANKYNYCCMQFNKNIEMYFVWNWVCAPQMKGDSSATYWRIASWIMHFLTPSFNQCYLVLSIFCSNDFVGDFVKFWTKFKYSGLGLSNALYFHRIQFLLKKTNLQFSVPQFFGSFIVYLSFH